MGKKKRITEDEHFEGERLEMLKKKKEKEHEAVVRAIWARIRGDGKPVGIPPGQPSGNQTLKEFREEILEIVWEHTAVGNVPRWGEWVPEYFVPRDHEREVDIAIDEAVARLLRKLRVV